MERAKVSGFGAAYGTSWPEMSVRITRPWAHKTVVALGVLALAVGGDPLVA